MRREKKRKLEYIKDKKIQFIENIKEEVNEQRKKLNENTMVVEELYRKQENQIALTEEEVIKLQNAENILDELRDRNNAIQDKLNSQVNSIKKKIVFYNTAAVPILIILSWIFISVYRRRRLLKG